jgi:hypothetical protein
MPLRAQPPPGFASANFATSLSLLHALAILVPQANAAADRRILRQGGWAKRTSLKLQSRAIFGFFQFVSKLGER